MKKIIAVFAFCCLMLPYTSLQSQGLHFLESVYDFAEIPMQDTLLHRFHFINNGDKAISIKEVTTDCSCAIIRYPQGDIAPKESGTVAISYLPYKVGGFHKKFEVITQTGSKHNLEILGNIIPFTDYKRHYAHTQGALRTTSKLLHFGRINTQNPVTKKFVFFNPTDTLIAFTGEVKVPSHIKVMFDTLHRIEPQSTANVYLTYDAAAKLDYGNVEDSVIIYTNYSANPRIALLISAHIEPYFAPLTEETIAEYPELSIEPKSLNLGYLYHKKIESDTIEAVFELQNKGFARLEILKIIPGNGCQLLSPVNEIEHIEPGERRKLRVRYTNTDRGSNNTNIILLCNDPRAPTQNLEIKATVR